MRITRAFFVSLAALASTANAACSTPSRPPVDPPAAAATGADDDVKSALAAHAARCEDFVERSDAARQGRCAERVVRAEDRAAFATCLRNRPCGDHPAECAAAVARRHDVDPAVESYAKACRAKNEACGPIFSESECGPAVAILVPELVVAFASCVSLDCWAAQSCVDEKLRAAGCTPAE